MTIAKGCGYYGCVRLATVEIHGSGHPSKPAVRKTYCDAHWDEAYETVMIYPTHGWNVIEQSADTLF